MSKPVVPTTCLDFADSLGEWPNCATPDCDAKACLSLSSPYCYPCTRLRDGLTWAQVQAECKENRRIDDELEEEEMRKEIDHDN